MAIEYFNAYHSYLKSVEPLNDAERGRLFTALLEYSSTGVVPDLRGNERFIFPTMKEQIDRDAKKYEDKCQKNRENALRRQATAIDGKRPPAKGGDGSQGKGEGKGKGKGEGNISPLTPSQGETGFGDQLYSAFISWLAYKTEKRQGYKPEGLKALITQIRNNAKQHSEVAVAELIGYCQANNWQGIAFDRLKGQQPKPKQTQQPQQGRKSWAEIAEEMEAGV